jgi:hypothetical protein
MIPVTQEEREWFLNNIALGLVEYMGVAEPPVPVEDLLKHPPDLYRDDFGVVDMRSDLWDATFARPLSKRGNIFVRMDLTPEERRFALARETLSALITSKQGRLMGLHDLFVSNLRSSADYFARALLAPSHFVDAFRKRKKKSQSMADEFGLPQKVADERWDELHDRMN